METVRTPEAALDLAACVLRSLFGDVNRLLQLFVLDLLHCRKKSGSRMSTPASLRFFHCSAAGSVPKLATHVVAPQFTVEFEGRQRMQA